MSIMPPRADRNRRCFRPCYPGTFCRCLGRRIECRDHIESLTRAGTCMFCGTPFTEEPAGEQGP